MKKFIYILLFAFATSFVVSSCSDEEVTPKSETTGTVGAGSGSQDPIKG